MAIAFLDRASWLRQLAYHQEQGVAFDRQVDHGMTHSLYIHDPNGYGVELLHELPYNTWGGDIQAAPNYVKPIPTEESGVLEDDQENVPVFTSAASD